MRETIGKFLASPLGSVLRVFVGAMFVAAMADITDLKNFDFADWKVYVGAGLTAVIPVAMAWFNGQDPRFGNVPSEPVQPPTSEQ